MYNFESTLGSIKYIREIIKYIRESAISLQSISEISSCFFGPRLWHIEIRHRVKKKHPQWICSDVRLSNWKFEDWNYGNRQYVKKYIRMDPALIISKRPWQRKCFDFFTQKCLHTEYTNSENQWNDNKYCYG